MPITLLCGRPENSRRAQTMASSGLVMQITKASGAWVLRPSPTAFMTLRLMPSRSSRLMPGLRGTPAVTMDTSAPADRGVVVGALRRDVLAEHRGGLGQVERLALRHAVGDVEQDDVAQPLAGGDVGQRAADHSGPDQGDLGARHGKLRRDRLGKRRAV